MRSLIRSAVSRSLIPLKSHRDGLGLTQCAGLLGEEGKGNAQAYFIPKCTLLTVINYCVYISPNTWKCGDLIHTGTDFKGEDSRGVGV